MNLLFTLEIQIILLCFINSLKVTIVKKFMLMMVEKTQNSVKIAPGAVVCVESEIRGDVTIGPKQ
jgi:hypothetical protein